MSAFCNLRSANRNMLFVGCSVKVSVVDVHAFVKMSQKFRNPAAEAESATYTFSILAGAAVCGFEMVRQDGTKIEGVVKEKEEAKKEYQEAVKQSHTASLGEEQTKDVFSIFVGNILPLEIVTINLRFLQPLLDDEKHDQIRFMFPRAYAQRYGVAPTSAAADVSAVAQPFELEMTIQQAGVIKSVACPSGHSITLDLEPPKGVPRAQSKHFAQVTLTEKSPLLTDDVLIVITAADLDAPRCFFEPHPSPDHRTSAVGLTFVPRFKVPDFDGGMEYIFLIDRSGSMEGESIKLVREALIVLLRGLPTKNTSFNLVSFGSSSSKLWASTQPYTQATLDEATRHVDSMRADFGGTEIARALATVFDSLQKPLQKPVSVFLLTDGGAWDIPSCVRHTEAAIRNLPGTNTFLRVFTVGIGSGVSTNTCDSIARAGSGISLYVSQGEAMTGKCSRLIRAARTPPVVDLTVSWPGHEAAARMEKEDNDFELVDASQSEHKPAEPRTVNLFQADRKEDKSDVGPPPKPVVTLLPPPLIQQAPITVPNIFPGTRTQLYAIVSDSCFLKHASLPASIRVCGTVMTTGDKVEVDVPVSKLFVPKAKTRDGGTQMPILHTLAAKALLTDREDGKHCFPASISNTFDTQPELKSAYLEKEIVRLGTTYSLTSRHTSFIAVDRLRSYKVLPALGRVEELSAEWDPPESWAIDMAEGSDGSMEESDDDMGFGLFDDDDTPAPPALRSALRYMSSAAAVSPPPANTKGEPTTSNPKTLDPGQRLAEIARLQSFDGAFELTETLLQLLGASITDVTTAKAKLTSLGLDAGVGATILAWNWLKLNAANDAPDMIEKAEDYIKDKLGPKISVADKAQKVAAYIPFTK